MGAAVVDHLGVALGDWDADDCAFDVLGGLNGRAVRVSRGDLDTVGAGQGRHAAIVRAIPGHLKRSTLLGAEFHRSHSGPSVIANGHGHFVRALVQTSVEACGLRAVEGDLVAPNRDLFPDQANGLVARDAGQLHADEVHLAVLRDGLLDVAKLRELTDKFGPLHGRERVLVLQLSHEQLQEGLLVDGAAVRCGLRFGGGRVDGGRRIQSRDRHEEI